jgi:hypothetical protein
MPGDSLRQLRATIQAIERKGPSVALIQNLLEGCGFDRHAQREPRQHAPDKSGVLAFPTNEKPLAFFPVGQETPRWREDVFPNMAKCWDTQWTEWDGGIGRAFLVTPKAILAYVFPLPPRKDEEVQPVKSLDFAEVQEWSPNLLLLTSDFTGAGSYWEFLTTPTANMRQDVNQRLVTNIQSWKTNLARYLAKYEPKVTSEDATNIIQSSLDQLLFIRFCEDRKVTSLGETLFDFTHGTISWSKLRSLVEKYRHILNGDIFSRDVFQKKYYPEGFIQEVLLTLYRDFSFETIPSDVLGCIYEQTLTRRLNWEPPKASWVEDDQLRKRFGVYYTPEPVAQHLSERAITIWREKSGRNLREVKILDPCAGSGTFLVQAMRVLFRHLGTSPGGLSIEERADILKRNIFGMDRELAPLERSALACYFEAVSGRGVAEGEQLLPRLLGRNLRQGDATQFPASEKDRPADIILLNPPYSRHAEADSVCWRIIRECMHQLPDDGVLATIVPDGILRNERLAPLRREILERCAIEEFGLVRCRVFPDPNIRPILLVARRVLDCHKRNLNVPKANLITSVVPAVKAQSIPRSMQQRVFCEDKLCRFNPHVSDTEATLVNRLHAHNTFAPLKNNFKIITEGVNNPPLDSLRTIPANGLPRESEAPYLEGKDIELFHHLQARRFIDYAKVVSGYENEKREIRSGKKKKSLVRPRKSEAFESVCKLLVRRSGSYVRASLDFGRHYVHDMVIVFQPDHSKCDSAFLHFLLGYLNSEICWFWLRLSNAQDPTVFPKWRQPDIADLCVPTSLKEHEIISIAVLAHRVSQCLASGYFGLDDPKIQNMRFQLLARIARALQLSEDEVNQILEFLNDNISSPYRPFRYAKEMPPLHFIELPERPAVTVETRSDLLAAMPPSDDDRRQKDEWEDRINGPLPDIYEVVPDPEQTALVEQLEKFSSRLDQFEQILRKRMK